MDYRKQMDLLTVYNCKINLLYGEWAKKQGMSYYTFTVLCELKGKEPCTQKQIAEKWQIPKQTVNTVIKDLQKKGYVDLREGRNQKEKLVVLTEMGHSFFKEAMEATNYLEEKILKKIGEKESQAIVDGFKKFSEIFEEEINNYGK